jgi:hypothetical protein
MDVTVDAIRKRISRGSIPHERDEDGRVWVVLDDDQDTASSVRDTDQSESAGDVLIYEMRGRIEDLREQLEAERQAHAEARRLLMAALERIPPQLEAPSEAAETGAEEPERAEPRPVLPEVQEGAQRRWWRRVFGG